MSDEEYDYGRLLVLRHVDYAGTGSLRQSLDGRAHRRPWDLVDVEKAGIPELTDDIRGILVLGGPMSVLDNDPWIANEQRLLAAAVDAGVPVFGICLGAQMLAAATGGTVTHRDHAVLGYQELVRTSDALEDDVFAGWVDRSMGFFGHDDEVSAMPPGALPMLKGPGGATVAYRLGGGLSYGVQFHPEVTPVIVTSWMERSRGRRMAAAAGYTIDGLVEEVTRRDRFTRAAGVSLVGRWIDGVVGRDDPTPRKQRKPAA